MLQSTATERPGNKESPKKDGDACIYLGKGSKRDLVGRMGGQCKWGYDR